MTSKEYLEKSQLKDLILIRVHEKKDKVTEIRLSDIMNQYTLSILEKVVKEHKNEANNNTHDPAAGYHANKILTRSKSLIGE